MLDVAVGPEGGRQSGGGEAVRRGGGVVGVGEGWLVRGVRRAHARMAGVKRRRQGQIPAARYPRERDCNTTK